MAAVVEITVQRTFEVKGSLADAFALVSDVPRSASHYPRVKQVHDRGDGVYRWEMMEIGMQAIKHQLVYSSKYVSDAEAGTVHWTPVPDGDSTVKGRWILTAKGEGCTLDFETELSLSLPVPSLFKSMVKTFVHKEFNNQVDLYVANLQKALS